MTPIKDDYNCPAHLPKEKGTGNEHLLSIYLMPGSLVISPYIVLCSPYKIMQILASNFLN